MLPPTTGLQQGSTLPTVFVTVEAALQGFGAVAATDRVLIHAAAGGVGLAAVQVLESQLSPRELRSIPFASNGLSIKPNED